jgi:predicted molibdopterin-dependent oxidoreductase YjgC
MPTVYTAYQPVTDPDARRKFEDAWHTRLPEQPGLTTTEMVDGILNGQVKGWYVMGENPLMSDPDLNHARHAIEQLEFFVAQDIFLNETNVYADVILPAASFAEKDGTFTNSDRRVQRIRQALPPPARSRPDWEIVADLARRTISRICQGGDRHPDSPCRARDEVICQNEDRILGDWIYAGPSEIWEEMRRVTPEFYGITYERIEREGGVHWPCPDLEHPGSPYLFAESFPRGRGLFWSVAYGSGSEQPDEAYPFILSTGRLLYHWHGGTLSRASRPGWMTSGPNAPSRYIPTTPDAWAWRRGIGWTCAADAARSPRACWLPPAHLRALCLSPSTSPRQQLTS